MRFYFVICKIIFYIIFVMLHYFQTAIALAAFVSLQSPPVQPFKCGTSRVSQQHIVGGQVAKPHQFGWIVYLQVQHSPLEPSSSTGDVFSFCGASLIDAQWVLTAGHCLDSIYAGYKVNLTGKITGVFYIEVLGGVLSVMPYEYLDRDAAISLTMTNFDRILSGKLNPQVAFAEGKLKVEGNIDKVLLLAELLKN